MPSTGPRALLSASRAASSRRRPQLSRAAFPSSFCYPYLVASEAQFTDAHQHASASRGIWSSSQSSTPNTNVPNGTGKGDNAPDDGKSPADSAPTVESANPNEVVKETLRGQGYGSARARASRPRVEEMPPVEIPDWYKDQYLTLECQRKPSTLPPLEEKDHGALLAVLESEMDQWSLKQKHVEDFKSASEHMLGELSHPNTQFSRRFILSDYMPTQFIIFALYATLLLAYNDPQKADLRQRLREISKWIRESDKQYSWRASSDERLSEAAKRWLAHVHRTEFPVGRHANDSLLDFKHSEREQAVTQEMLCTIRSELLAQYPNKRATKDLNRPVTVLSVMNYRGRLVAKSVIEDIAIKLQADVVLLDASSVARIVGGHLGQTPYWNRGPISMLGYGAAELNGRQTSRASEPTFEIDIGALTSKLNNYGSKRDYILSVGSSDSRWEDLKLNQVLERLVNAADIKAAALGQPPNDRLIIHIHDYAEIHALSENIIEKLRTIVDRMWQRGRKVVIVGSTSGDVNQASQWQSQVSELAREECHIVPFHVSDPEGTKEFLEAMEYWRENLSNIRTMALALKPDLKADYWEEYHFEKSTLLSQPLIRLKSQGLPQALSLARNLYDAQWVYRYASLLLGSQRPEVSDDIAAGCTPDDSVLNMMSKDENWADLYPKAQAPYYSPLAGARTSSSMMDREDREWSPSPSGKPTSRKTAKDLDSSEKALLTGLIDAKDIHTSFDDIIVPAATKESLKALTSLSLVRPDAFSYGVLKTERIPGCLLYGPPGNGKTLLAKAVARESGANMLEISAASINDRWLGASEKNVRAIFSLARKMAPMVIFIDEADALLSARGSSQQRPAHRETITQFLREWDGLSDMRAFIMVATNRPFDLDEAILRRLPRRILVDLPLRPERESILRIVLREETLGADVDLPRIAAQTELYSGSDMKNLCVAAAMEAVRAENRAKEAHTGPEDFVFPKRRVLTEAHFKTAMREISASISEEMETLKAIRKFDAQYGDAGRKKRRKSGMGFEVAPGQEGSEGARVRQESEKGREPSVAL